MLAATALCLSDGWGEMAYRLFNRRPTAHSRHQVHASYVLDALHHERKAQEDQFQGALSCTPRARLSIQGRAGPPPQSRPLDSLVFEKAHVVLPPFSLGPREDYGGTREFWSGGGVGSDFQL